METRQIKVNLIDHMGSDLSVVNAARVSFLGESQELTDKDEKLIHYLKEHQHDSPFEHCTATFKIECDLNTAVQILRHRTFAYNMVSRRYTSDDIWFYKPDLYREQAKNNRQASIGPVDDQDGLDTLFAEHYRTCLDAYNEALERGLCREQARFLLPQGMGTAFYMTGNLRNWMHFLNLRDSTHAQGEVREVATLVREQLRELFPVSMDAFDRYWRMSVIMSDAIKEAKRHHKDLTDSRPEDQFKQGYRAALSWLLITLGEDD